MTNDKHILTTRVTLNSYDLLVMDGKFVESMVKDKIHHNLAAEISKKVELTERPNFQLHAKEIEARVAVLTMEEYSELKRKIRDLEEEIERLLKFEEIAIDFAEKVDDIEFGTFEMDDDED